MQDCKIGYLPTGYFNQLETINKVLFTAREIDTIACVLHMRGSSKIASILDIAPRTVETHIVNIKRKIDNKSREGVIDFIERSGKYFMIRKHYQNLLIQANFNKKLKSLANYPPNNTPICYFFCCHEKYKGSIIPIMQTHLKLTGVTLNICSISEKFVEPKQEEHFIYVISENTRNQPGIFKALQESKRKPSFFTFIVMGNMNLPLSQELIDSPYIDLSKCKNYYLAIFEIFKRISPKINFDNIISQLECYQQSVTDPQGPPEIYTSNNLKKSIIDNNKLYNSNLYNRWLILILLGLMLIAIWRYNQIMVKEPISQDNNISQRLLSTAKPKFYITSYIPEILTGYEHFIGRKKELQQIEQSLREDNIVVITGPGGVGKSSCAIEYGKLNKPNKIVRYLNAESAAKIDQQYMALAQELNINVEKQPRNIIMLLVNNKLNAISTEILFIFDNIDQYDDAKEYLINLPMNIKAIITTRQPILIANRYHIALEEFSHKEAEEYLKNSLQNRRLTGELIHDLVENTGTLPYDLKCVAAYLLENPSIDHKAAVNKIGSKVKDKLFEEFIVSFDPIKQQAWKILQYTANLDPDFISVDIVKALFPKELEISFAALKKLESLSLISIINDQNDQPCFKIHRKLQKNVQNSIKNHQKYSIDNQKLMRHLLSVFNQLLPEVTFQQNSQWQIAARMQPHVEKLLNEEAKVAIEKDHTNLANLYYKLARYYSAVNINYQQSLKYAKTALDLRNILYKSHHSDLANSYNDVGVIYRKLGNTQKGLEYLKQGLKIRQKLYGGDHYAIADSLHTIGSAYNQHGETEKGLKYAQMALEMNKRLYPGDHYEIGCSLNLVGISYLDLGNLQKSLEYFKAGLKMFTELTPISYERIASLQSNIAYNYNKLGNYSAALQHATAAVDIFKKTYPDGHPKAIYSLDDLGDSLIRTNNITKALTILHRALSLSEKFSMDKHCITAFVLHDLGRGYLKTGDYKSALQYGEKALILRKELYSNVKNHHELAESLHVVGDVYLALGNRNQSIKLYQEALDMYIKLLLEHAPEFSEIKQKINQLQI